MAKEDQAVEFEIDPDALMQESLDSIQMNSLPDELSLLPIRDVVVFPGTIVPLVVGRRASLKMIDQTLEETNVIGLITQKDGNNENPDPEDLYDIGCAVVVLKTLRQPDDSLSIIVQGLTRFRVREFLQIKPYMRITITPLEDRLRSSRQLQAAVKNLRETALELIDLTPQAPEQARTLILNIDEPGGLADFLTANLSIDVEKRQKLLSQVDVEKRIRAVQVEVARQLDIAQLQEKIQEDVQEHISDMQRKMYLREQLNAIQKELGSEDGAEDQIEELQRKLYEAAPPEAVMKEAKRELKRLRIIPSASPEHSVIVTYLETISQLPWNAFSADMLELDNAQKILDRDHYDLSKVKKRLLEYLAVRKLNPTGPSPILCLVGPPGVGKTSLGKSVADAMGRQFARLSLGGIRDEAEIRGHRRTYIGSMPGRIIQELRRAGTKNPVLMLDEIDKMGADFRGDPGSALLEVLDPRQNGAFVDRYLDVPFDLSNVMFIATANYLEPVPPALRDRMEIIEIPGYTHKQKVEIAKRYLVPRQLKDHGLKRKDFKFLVSALNEVVEFYTREAGVRECERQLGAVCRSLAAKVATGQLEQAKVSDEMIRELLGAPKYTRDEANHTDTVGLVNGLAFTPYGGEVLNIEVIRYPGKGLIKITGQIGDVMKESAEAALSLVRAYGADYGVDVDQISKFDYHIHVPSGAVPKDGPSAGVAMVTTLVSLLSDRKVKSQIAMTGEVTLSGRVLPIGGLKEKTLAAMRTGIKEVIIPRRNEKDMEDVTPEARKKLKFHFVEVVDDVLKLALK